MLDCPRMSHRVHTILSLLAEDHAPAALRPSILLAVDWPTVAEEAPATGDDASAAAIAHLRIQGIVADNHRATAPLAARLATVAAALASSGDKAMATHATALWGAAAALAGIPTAAAQTSEFATPECLAARYMSALATKAADIVGGAIASGPAEKATLIGTALDRVRDMKPTLDKALADIHALRDILGVPDGGNLVDHASAFAERHMRRCDEADIEAGRMNEENTKLKSENPRLRAQVDRMIAAMREDAPAPVKARPQPGDRVPWADVEDGALYWREWSEMFCMVVVDTLTMVYDHDDKDILRALAAPDMTIKDEAVLVARDLGTDPEAWRKAMREWTANGDKPCAAK